MEPFFDPRKLLRTPGFAIEGLEDDDYLESPPDLDIAGQPSMGISGMLAATPPDVPPRQPMSMPPMPLPPKTGKLRNVLGVLASAYVPSLGEEIRQPGYKRQLQEWAGNRQNMMDRAELAHKAAQTEAQMGSAGASQARRQAELARAGSYGPKPINVPGNADLFDPTSNKVLHSNRLPPKAEPPMFDIGQDGRLKIPPEGLKVPAGLASTMQQMRPKVDAGYATLKQTIRDANPDWEDADVDAAASKAYSERKEAELAKIKRAPSARTLTPAQELSEGRRTVSEKTAEAVVKYGDVDKAIAAIESWPERDEMANKVLTELKVQKAKKAGKGGRDVRGLLGGGQAPVQAKTAAPAIGTEKGGYRFKGGNPADKNNWEKI